MFSVKQKKFGQSGMNPAVIIPRDWVKSKNIKAGDKYTLAIYGDFAIICLQDLIATDMYDIFTNFIEYIRELNLTSVTIGKGHSR